MLSRKVGKCLAFIFFIKKVNAGQSVAFNFLAALREHLLSCEDCMGKLTPSGQEQVFGEIREEEELC
jgi:hypothetical protein